MTAITDATDSGQSQFLTFHLAGEEYGVRILKVKEILEYDTVTKVPAAPSFRLNTPCRCSEGTLLQWHACRLHCSQSAAGTAATTGCSRVIGRRLLER